MAKIKPVIAAVLLSLVVLIVCFGYVNSAKLNAQKAQATYAANKSDIDHNIARCNGQPMDPLQYCAWSFQTHYDPATGGYTTNSGWSFSDMMRSQQTALPEEQARAEAARADYDKRVENLRTAGIILPTVLFFVLVAVVTRRRLKR